MTGLASILTVLSRHAGWALTGTRRWITLGPVQTIAIFGTIDAKLPGRAFLGAQETRVPGHTCATITISRALAIATLITCLGAIFAKETGSTSLNQYARHQLLASALIDLLDFAIV